MSRVARRIVLALMLAALLPLFAAMVLALGLTEFSLGVGLNETVRRGLSNDIPLYRSLFEAKKAHYKAAGRSLTRNPDLLQALREKDEEALAAFTKRALKGHPDLILIEIHYDDKQKRASRRAEPGSRPLTMSVEVPPKARVDMEFRLPAKYVQGLGEARELAETYQMLSAARDGITRNLLLSFTAVLLVVLVGAVLVGMLLARNVTRRVTRLASATAVVADGDLSVRVDESGSDEIAELGHSFNTMVSELEERRDRIIYLEKISGWQEVARRLAHEIKNPLTPIVLAVQQLDEKKPTEDEKFCKLVTTVREIIDEEVASLRHLVQEFSSFAKLPTVHADQLDLGQYLDEVFSQIAATTPQADMTIEIAADLGEIPVDRMMMRRVLANLIANAVEAQPKAERPTVRVQALRDQQTRVVRVEDAGPGIEPEVAQRVFEPYVTSKKQGTGLGLAIVKKIVLQHGGTISAGSSKDLGGACFEVRLPQTKQLRTESAELSRVT